MTAPFNWYQTVYSQYANSSVLLAWLDYFSQWIDANANVDAFYVQQFDIATAQGYGLDVWGRILGIGRTLNVTGTSVYFGFEESDDTDQVGFDQAPFYSGEPLTGSYPLPDDQYRILLMAKAATNIWDGSILGLNAILRMLFPGQVAYVVDGLNMTMEYYLDFVPTAVQLAIVNSGVLPRPCGVFATVVHL